MGYLYILVLNKLPLGTEVFITLLSNFTLAKIAFLIGKKNLHVH